MSSDVCVRTQRTLLLAAEKNEANGAPGDEPHGLDGSGRLNDEGGIAAIVERAGAKLPGVEVRPKNNDFIGSFAAANFADNVFLFHRTAHLVWHDEPHPNFSGTGRN